jgi:hypothetical protein
MISETQTCTPELPTTTPSLTWTPISTLLPNDREEYLQTLFENNGDCNLPCWWGIMPGETTWEEARTTLLPLGILKTSGNDDYVRATFSIPVPLTLSDEISPGFPYFEPNLIIQDNLVEKITINSSWITDDFDHSLNGFLELLGTPTNIVIRSTLDVMEEAPYWNKPFYEMIVFFPSKGVVVYSKDMYQVTSSHLEVCPGDARLGTSAAGIELFEPNSTLTLERFYEINNKIDLGNYQSLSEISSVTSMEEFYSKFLNADVQQCVDIDMNRIVDWHDLD